jgi:hypothetical protein
MTLSTMGWVQSHINLQLASSHHQPPQTPPEKDTRMPFFLGPYHQMPSWPSGEWSDGDELERDLGTLGGARSNPDRSDL